MIDLDSSDWHLFATWAADFYKAVVKTCIAAAGPDNPEIFSRLLERSLPSVLELYELWKEKPAS